MSELVTERMWVCVEEWLRGGVNGVCEFVRAFVSEWLSEWVSEGMSVWDNERTDEWMSMNEWVFGWMNERRNGVFEWVCVR